MEDQFDKLPSNLQKIINKLSSVKEKMDFQKETIDEIGQEIKLIEKFLTKFIAKITKPDSEKKPRKLCGFALPSSISDDLCDFLGKDRGTKVARTEVTKYLMSYISTHKLQNPENKKEIIPDETLWKILGDEAKDKLITHFTIQKYINKHFVK